MVGVELDRRGRNQVDEVLKVGILSFLFWNWLFLFQVIISFLCIESDAGCIKMFTNIATKNSCIIYCLVL